MPQSADINVKRPVVFVTDLLSIGLCVSVLGVAMSVLVMVRAKQADLGSSASDRLRSVVRGGRSQGHQETRTTCGEHHSSSSDVEPSQPLVIIGGFGVALRARFVNIAAWNCIS